MDRKNQDTKWADAIAAEMMALDKIGVWEFHDPNWKPPKDFQHAPLHMVFDVKTEDLRRKTRLVIGGNVVDSSVYESFASVAHATSVKLVLLIAKNQGLKRCWPGMCDVHSHMRPPRNECMPEQGQSSVSKRVQLL